MNRIEAASGSLEDILGGQDYASRANDDPLVLLLAGRTDGIGGPAPSGVPLLLADDTTGDPDPIVDFWI